MPSDNTRYYDGVRFNITSIGGMPFAIAETPIVNGRQHRRIIAYSYKTSAPLYGRPIVYSDHYLASHKKYVYVRHKADPVVFFKQLDYFYYQHFRDYAELEGREFKMQLNIGGNLEEVDQRFPYSPVAPLDRDIRFFRIAIPFGDVAVEFSETKEFRDELTLMGKKRLPQALESPLLGCDLTKGNLLSKLIVNLHWAQGMIPTSILEQAIAELISEGIPA